MNKKLVGVLAAVLAVCVAAGAIGSTVLKAGKSGSTSDACFWVSDDQLYYSKNYHKQTVGAPVAWLDFYDSNVTASDMMSRAFFSPDGKYLYYFSSFNGATSPAPLYRILVSKIGADLEENEAQAEEVARYVSPMDLHFDDNGLLHFRRYGASTDAGFDLCTFDGERVDVVLSGIQQAFSTGGAVYYLEEDDDDGYQLSVYNSSGHDGNKKIAAHVLWAYSAKEGTVLYTVKQEESYLNTVYLAKADGTSETIAEDVYICYSDNPDAKGFYYTTQNKREVSRGQFVTNSHAAQDAAQEEPSYSDSDYDAKYEAYEAAQSRMEAMEHFQDSTITLTEDALYFYDWEKAASTLITDALSSQEELKSSVFASGNSSMVWYYKKPDSESVTVDVQEVVDRADHVWFGYGSELDETLNEILEEKAQEEKSQLCYSLDGAAEQRLDPAQAGIGEQATDVNLVLYEDASKIAMMGFLEDDESDEEWSATDVYTADVKNGTFGPWKKLDLDNVSEIDLRYDNLMCKCEEDAYLIQDGKPVLAQVGDGRWVRSSDGSLLSIWEGAAYSSELALTKKSGAVQSIDKEVSDAVCLENGDLLYLRKNGDLIYYTGKKAKKLAENVSAFWCPNSSAVIEW